MGDGKNEKIEKRWRTFQKHLGCTDEELSYPPRQSKACEAGGECPCFREVQNGH